MTQISLMSLIRMPFDETWLWESRSGASRDDLGNVVQRYAAPVTVSECSFDPGGSVELRNGGSQRVDTTPTLYLPAVPVGPGDRFTGHGATFEVEGEPRDWGIGILIVNLGKVTG